MFNCHGVNLFDCAVDDRVSNIIKPKCTKRYYASSGLERL